MMEILKVLVGSRAHGLHSPESDYDYRAVHVTPTAELLSLPFGKTKGTNWTEGADDNTSYEVGHFLQLALQSNPSILEVFQAPVITAHGEHGYIGWDVASQAARDSFGNELRALFPHVWSARQVAAAFGGYSHNQQKKFLSSDPKYSQRKRKYAVSYIRVLLQGIELLSTGTFSIAVLSQYDEVPKEVKQRMDMASLRTGFTPWPTFLQNIKKGIYSTGMIIDTAETLRGVLDALAEEGPFKDLQPDLSPVNKFLLEVRREIWESN